MRVERDVGVFCIRAAYDIAIHILPAILRVAGAGERFGGKLDVYIMRLRASSNRTVTEFACIIGNRVGVDYPVRIKRNVGIFRVRAAHDIAIYILPAILRVAGTSKCLTREYEVYIMSFRAILNRTFAEFASIIGNRVGVRNPLGIENLVARRAQRDFRHRIACEGRIIVPASKGVAITSLSFSQCKGFGLARVRRSAVGLGTAIQFIGKCVNLNPLSIQSQITPRPLLNLRSLCLISIFFKPSTEIVTFEILRILQRKILFFKHSICRRI